jgi:hypothetical protein
VRHAPRPYAGFEVRRLAFSSRPTRLGGSGFAIDEPAGPVAPEPWRVSDGVVKTAGAGLCRLADVAVMQATDFGKLHDLPRHGERDRPEVGCVLVQRKVGARLMVVGEIAGQDAAEVSLAEDEHVIQALAPDRADEPVPRRDSAMGSAAP